MTLREQRGGGESYHKWGGPKPFLGRGFMVCFPLPWVFPPPFVFSDMEHAIYESNHFSFSDSRLVPQGHNWWGSSGSTRRSIRATFLMGSFLVGSLQKVLANLRGKGKTLEITAPKLRKNGLSYKCCDPKCLLQGPETPKVPKVVRRGCKRCFGLREQRSPKSLLHHPNPVLHRCNSLVHQCKRTLPAWARKTFRLLHPLLTTLGTFEVSGPCSRHPGSQYKCANYPCRNYPLTSARIYDTHLSHFRKHVSTWVKKQVTMTFHMLPSRRMKSPWQSAQDLEDVWSGHHISVPSDTRLLRK